MSSRNQIQRNICTSKIAKLVSDLFTARWLDQNITAVNTKLRENFMIASKRIFKKPVLDFSSLNLGSEWAKIVAQILTVYTYKPYENDAFPHKNSDKALPWSKVNLSNNSFGMHNLKTLIRVCLNHPRLIYLNLQNNDIDDLTLSYLLRNMQRNITIVHLDIGNTKMLNRNRVRKRSSIAFRGLLTNNKSLQILGLQDWGINSETFGNIIEGVVRSQLISLNLSQNDINDECISLMNEKYSNIKYQLQELILTDTQISGNVINKREFTNMVRLFEMIIF